MRRPALTGSEGDVPGLLGTTILRGKLVAVLDLGALLRLGEGAPGERMISVEVEERCVALVVDEVLGVRTIDAEALTTIALPGAVDRPMGSFDEGFARLVEASGLLPEEMWTLVDDAAAAASRAGVVPV